jgi:hypothetical protein
VQYRTAVKSRAMQILPHYFNLNIRKTRENVGLHSNYKKTDSISTNTTAVSKAMKNLCLNRASH